MGAWGYRTFEDDRACDWLDELTAAEGTELLRLSLMPHEATDEHLTYGEAVGILAAAEIIYALLNQPREGLPDKAVFWVNTNKNADVACLKPVCERQVGCVLSEQSELRKAWQENEKLYPEWKANVESLRDALKD